MEEIIPTNKKVNVRKWVKPPELIKLAWIIQKTIECAQMILKLILELRQKKDTAKVEARAGP